MLCKHDAMRVTHNDHGPFSDEIGRKKPFAVSARQTVGGASDDFLMPRY